MLNCRKVKRPVSGKKYYYLFQLIHNFFKFIIKHPTENSKNFNAVEGFMNGIPNALRNVHNNSFSYKFQNILTKNSFHLHDSLLNLNYARTLINNRQ